MEKQFSTLQQMLQYSINEYSSRDSFAFVGSKPLTYNEFGNRVLEYSKTLVQQGIKNGDKVAILSANMPQWVVAYFSIVHIGAVVVPLMTDFSEHELENILTHSETKAIFVQERLGVKNKSSIAKVNVQIKIEDGLVISKNNIDPIFEPSEKYVVQPNDLAAIIYTSGTTGKSKGVMLSHKNLVSQIKMVAILQPVFDTDVFLSVLPLSHTYEASLSMLTAIMSGSSVYYLEKPPTAPVLLPALKLVKPTMMLTVPLIIEKIFKSKVLPELTKTPMLRFLYSIPLMRKVMHKKAAAKIYETFGGKIRFFGIGGAKLDSKVEQFLLEGKFPYAIGYGLTETAPLLAGVNPSMVHLQSTGPAIQGVELKINKPDLKTGEGEIWAKGDNIMLGYYKEPEITKQVITHDGWFKTGDIGSFDNKNRLYIKSRLKNVIIGSNGENIYPEDIESVINSHRFVSESIVVEKKGRLVALVNFNMEDVEKNYEQMKTNFNHKVDSWKLEFDEMLEQLKVELIHYVNTRVSASSKITYVVALSSEFEKTPTQKIKRFKYAMQ